ncbi:hypothetical protein B296_00004471 [Ensete ventricosum]|uniref:Uncharacterized protein n=1 Tax=Ensete ventricosum TaxID=4639 RepID=A0A427B5Y0_ENSVE|nr:hypothetical protein B296_00004471 [Ensete ventricosum]
MHPSIASTLTKSAPAFLKPKCRCLFCSLHMLCDPCLFLRMSFYLPNSLFSFSSSSLFNIYVVRPIFSMCIEFLTLFFLFFFFQFCQAKEEQNAICNRAVTIEKRMLMPASTLTSTVL